MIKSLNHKLLILPKKSAGTREYIEDEQFIEGDDYFWREVQIC